MKARLEAAGVDQAADLVVDAEALAHLYRRVPENPIERRLQPGPFEIVLGPLHRHVQALNDRFLLL